MYWQCRRGELAGRRHTVQLGRWAGLAEKMGGARVYTPIKAHCGRDRVSQFEAVSGEVWLLYAWQ